MSFLHVLKQYYIGTAANDKTQNNMNKSFIHHFSDSEAINKLQKENSKLNQILEKAEKSHF